MLIHLTPDHFRETAMHTAKQEALEAIGKLPEDARLDDIMYRLYVLDKIRQGREAVAQGRTITGAELGREIEPW